MISGRTIRRSTPLARKGEPNTTSAVRTAGFGGCTFGRTKCRGLSFGLPRGPLDLAGFVSAVEPRCMDLVVVKKVFPIWNSCSEIQIHRPFERCLHRTRRISCGLDPGMKACWSRHIATGKIEEQMSDWSQRFEQPITLSDGCELATLADARGFVLSLPVSVTQTHAWNIAVAQLLIAARDGDATQIAMARTALERAIRDVSPGMDWPAESSWMPTPRQRPR
jgi:hypothetical protein